MALCLTGGRTNHPRSDHLPSLKYILCVCTFPAAGNGIDCSALCREDRNTSSGEIRLQILFDGGWVNILAAIEPLQDFVHDLLGLVALAVQQKAVENVLPAHGLLDLGFLVVF